MKSEETIKKEIDRLRHLYYTQEKSYETNCEDREIDDMIAELEEMRQTLTIIHSLEWVLIDKV